MRINNETAEAEMTLILTRVRDFFETLKGIFPTIDYTASFVVAGTGPEDGPALTGHMLMNNVPGSLLIAEAMKEAALIRCRAVGISDEQMTHLQEVGRKMGPQMAHEKMEHE